MTGFSALPLADEAQQPESQTRWSGTSKILGPAWSHLPSITLGLLGVQIFWSVEMSYASPYLISLGLTKSLMAIVFLAGPLSGLIVQPLIGVLADNCKSRFGRRRPYMIGGSFVCVFAMTLLGFTRPIATIFINAGSDANDILTIWLAILSIYCIDFSINAIMAVDRALVVDTLPASVQASANAWGARMLGIGSVAGFFIGNIDLPRIFPFLGSAQLEVLSVIASFLLLGTHFVTAGAVRERVLVSPSSGKGGFRQQFKAIFENMLTLPPVIRKICVIQFFAWLAWFPILFYTTVYIGDLHKRASPSPQTDDEADALDAEATRLGSRALLFSALISLAANVLLPFFVSEAKQGKRTPKVMGQLAAWMEYLQIHLATLWAASHAVFALCMLGTLFTDSVPGATFLMSLTGFSWAITQWAPFSLLAESILSERSAGAEDVGSIRLTDTRTFRDNATGAEEEREHFLVGDAEHDGDEKDDSRSSGEGEEDRQPERNAPLGNPGARVSRLDISSLGNGHGVGHGDENEDGDDLGKSEEGRLSAKAGIILGIHNVFIVVPQFVIAGISSIIFAIFEPEKSVLHGKHPGNIGSGIGNSTVTTGSPLLRQEEVVSAQIPGQSPGAVGMIFRIGGVSAAIAFVLCWRLARELRHR